MFKLLKRFFAIVRCVNNDTRLWCVSVLAGAVLLCISFFVEPSLRQFEESENAGASIARQKVIEYSSVLGSLSSIETLGNEEVEEIAEAIPDITLDVLDEADPSSYDEYFEDEVLPETVKQETADEPTPVLTLPQTIDLSTVYSPEAVDMLERLVQCEAATEDMDGRILVANVVLNRVDTGIWGNDILSVLTSEGQFDPIGNGAYKKADVDPVTKKAVINALMGEDISQGAIYFQKSNAKIWGNKKFLFRHGSHSFYK